MRRPTRKLERDYAGPVCGVDEAGRGPWAGPVCAAAVILPSWGVPKGIDDSKKVPAKRPAKTTKRAATRTTARKTAAKKSAKAGAGARKATARG